MRSKVAAATLSRAVDRTKTSAEDDDDVEEAAEPAVTIEITRAVALHPARRERGRARGRPAAGLRHLASRCRECDATVTDRVEDTVDYAEVCEQVALAAQERSYRTLERLCTAVADRLLDRFGAEEVDRARRQARAANRPAGGGGGGGGVEGGLVALRAGAGQRPRPPTGPGR